jgi:hypothetical protein
MPDAPDASVAYSRKAKLQHVFDSLERSLRTLLGKPFRFGRGTSDFWVPAKAFQDLGANSTLLNLYGGNKTLAFSVAFDAVFGIMTAGTLMMMPAGSQQERIKKLEIDGLLLETTKEVANVMSGLVAEELRTAVGDPRAVFGDEELSAIGKHSRNALLVVEGQAELDGRPAGRAQVWLTTMLLGKIR